MEDLQKNKKIYNKKNNKIFYLDVLRVIACLSVIMIHSSAEYVLKDFGTFNFWVGNILDSISRFGVPIFVMISGALMLDKNYKLDTQKLIKKIKKFLIFFIVWSAVYSVSFYILSNFIKNEAINVKGAISSFARGYFHLWFIYLIIGLYLITPLLRLWVKDENKKYVKYFIILSVIFTYGISHIVSIGSNYSNIFVELKDVVEKSLQIKYVGGFTTYYILGWYINNYEIKHKKIIYLLGVLGLFVSAMGTYILSATTGKAIQIFDNLSLNVLAQSVAIFVFVKAKFLDFKNKENRIINSIAKHSLGIYVIHAAFITIMNEFLKIKGVENAALKIPIVFIVTFIGSYVISIVFKKLPILKKLV